MVVVNSSNKEPVKFSAQRNSTSGVEPWNP